MFKIFSLTLIALLFLACGNAEPIPHAKSFPSWFVKKEFVPHAEFELVGYGHAATLQEAMAQAKEEIALTLLSKVESRFTSHSTDDESRSVAELKVTSKLNLQNLKTLKQEQVANTFFVALSYENLDFASRVKRDLNISTCQDEKLGRYIPQSVLHKKLMASLGCKLDFKLHRQNSAWYLKYKEHLFLLSDKEFEELYATQKSSSFTFRASKDVLLDTESFWFEFETKESGYITLLDVYENGIVTLLSPSTKIENNIQIPSKESSHTFVAGVVQEGVDTHDLYVALFTKEPLDMSRFIHADGDLTSNEKAYKMDELIELLNSHDYATLLLRTKAQ